MFWPVRHPWCRILVRSCGGSIIKPQLEKCATTCSWVFIMTVMLQADGGVIDVIIQLFEWNWDSIAAECTNLIEPAGYGYVQVSPPSEHIQGTSWWTDYQIVSYILTSKRGNRSRFSNMITTCHAAGVTVIVDTVFNHMTGYDNGTGVAGSSHYNYPGIYTTSDFHHCGLTPNDDTVDYRNRAQILTCELSNLADLATETEYVRATLATFLNGLVSLGVDGYRLDAAKHIAASDIANILSRTPTVSYITQEVIRGNGDGVQPTEYIGIGSAQEFRYKDTIKDAFQSSGISNHDNRGWISSSLANVFIINHDTERGGSSLSYPSPSNTYTLAMVFSLPPVRYTDHSELVFVQQQYAGGPNSFAGTCSGSAGTNGWPCQHHWQGWSASNAVGSSAMTKWATGTSQQIAFGRGSIGFVVINNDSSWSTSFPTWLPAGVYCEVYTGPMNGSSCSGTSYTVSGGVFSAMIAARTGLALHTSAVLSFSTSTSSVASTSVTASTSSTSSVSASVTVTSSVTATTTWGQNIYVTGSIYQPGSWTPASGKALSSASYPVLVGSVSIPVGTTFSYKYTKVQGTTVTWESDPNRSYTVSSSAAMTINDTWRCYIPSTVIYVSRR